MDDSKCELVINGIDINDATSKEKEEDFDIILKKKQILNFNLIENQFHLRDKDYLSRKNLRSLIESLTLDKKKYNGSLLLYTRY